MYLTSKDRFGGERIGCTLEELAQAAPPITIENPFMNISEDEIMTKISTRRMWRYHHGLDVLLSAPPEEKMLHVAYAKRVDAMLPMIDEAIRRSGVNLATATIADLACAEGFVSSHLVDRGAASVDCFELNELQIERLHLVEALRRRDALNVYRLDFERPFWRLSIPKTYDLVMCLGIVYHMESPMIFLRNVASLTGKACIFESDTPSCEGSTLTLVDQQVTLAKGDVRKLIEMRPSPQALVEMILAAGFTSVEEMPIPENCECPYFAKGTKRVFLAMK